MKKEMYFITEEQLQLICGGVFPGGGALPFPGPNFPAPGPIVPNPFPPIPQPQPNPQPK